jgi:hypothetical protein
MPNRFESLLHNVLDMLPFRDETARDEAKTVVSEEVPQLYGHNTVPNGVVTPDPDDVPRHSTDPNDAPFGGIPVDADNSGETGEK